MRQHTKASRLPDEWLGLDEAAQLVPKRACGRGATPETLHRWSTRGLNGIRLPARKFGAFWFVKRQDLFEFFDRVTQAAIDHAQRRHGELVSK